MNGPKWTGGWRKEYAAIAAKHGFKAFPEGNWITIYAPDKITCSFVPKKDEEFEITMLTAVKKEKARQIKLQAEKEERRKQNPSSSLMPVKSILGLLALTVPLISGRSYRQKKD